MAVTIADTIPKSNQPTITVKPASNLHPHTKEQKLKIGTWNIRRGIIKRELEIAQLLENEGLDILFLTKTDTMINQIPTVNIEIVFKTKRSNGSKSIECRRANVRNTEIDRKLGKRMGFDRTSKDRAT